MSIADLGKRNIGRFVTKISREKKARYSNYGKGLF
jgi:hypothetical protein